MASWAHPHDLCCARLRDFRGRGCQSVFSPCGGVFGSVFFALIGGVSGFVIFAVTGGVFGSVFFAVSVGVGP